MAFCGTIKWSLKFLRHKRTTAKDPDKCRFCSQEVFMTPKATTSEKLSELEMRLKAFEQHYQMRSEDFYRRFQQGQLGDSADFFEWSAVYTMHRSVVERLLQEDQDPRWSMIIGSYRDGDINLGKAAELLGLHELALRERLIELGIPVRIGASDLAEARAEADAILSWLNTEP